MKIDSVTLAAGTILACDKDASHQLIVQLWNTGEEVKITVEELREINRIVRALGYQV